MVLCKNMRRVIGYVNTVRVRSDSTVAESGVRPRFLRPPVLLALSIFLLHTRISSCRMLHISDFGILEVTRDCMELVTILQN